MELHPGFQAAQQGVELGQLVENGAGAQGKALLVHVARLVVRQNEPLGRPGIAGNVPQDVQAAAGAQKQVAPGSP